MVSDQDQSVAGRLGTTYLEARHGFLKWLTTSRPRYEALSYCWGNGTKTHPITLNGREVKIHASLHAALLLLKEKRPGVPIWADAICIDQENEPKKLTQIKIMGKIYKTSRKVWAFLGTGPVGIDEAMPLLPLFCSKAREIQEPQWSKSAKLDMQGVGRGIKIHDLPPRGSPFWLTINELVYNKYFDRLWVLQEVAFATRLEFLFGRHQISWDQMKLLFGTGIQHFEGFRPPPSFPPVIRNDSVFLTREFLLYEGLGHVAQICSNFFITYCPLLSAFFERNLKGTVPDLWAILRRIRDKVLLLQDDSFQLVLRLAVRQECSKPEDRIYAILGLLAARLGDAKFPGTTGQSVCKIYLEAFYYLVQKDTSLHLLSMAIASPQNALSLPSWCPSFHHRGDWRSEDRRRVNTSRRSWHASRRKQIVRRGRDSMKLRLTGVRVCRVQVLPGTRTALYTGHRRNTAIEASVQANFQWLCLCLDTVVGKIDKSSPMYRNKLNEFLRTMLLGNCRIIADDDLNLDDFWATMQLLRRSVSEESTFAEEMRLIIEPVEPGQIRLPPPRQTSFIVQMESQITH